MVIFLCSKGLLNNKKTDVVKGIRFFIPYSLFLKFLPIATTLCTSPIGYRLTLQLKASHTLLRILR